jgi:hypothetical protein
LLDFLSLKSATKRVMEFRVRARKPFSDLNNMTPRICKADRLVRAVPHPAPGRSRAGNSTNADLRLKMNFSTDDTAQSWSIVRHPDDHPTTGLGTPDEIAHRVCAIAKQTVAGRR